MTVGIVREDQQHRSERAPRTSLTALLLSTFQIQNYNAPRLLPQESCISRLRPANPRARVSARLSPATQPPPSPPQPLTDKLCCRLSPCHKKNRNAPQKL
eukprot:4677965-Pleurochrysis_carterae.AAC.5